MTPKRRDRIIQALSSRQTDLTVITDSVVKERNLAAIIRTCDAVGIPDLHCVQQREGYRTYAGVSASAQKYVSTYHYDSIESPISKLKASGYQIVAAHFSGAAIDYREVDYTKPTALVMGTELTGVSNEGIALADTSIIIPMMGMVESFNVSVACAIILSHAQGQRQSAGMYDSNSIGEEAFKRMFFQWAYPKLTKFCDERGLEYPAMKENGDLLEPNKNPILP